MHKLDVCHVAAGGFVQNKPIRLSPPEQSLQINHSHFLPIGTAWHGMFGAVQRGELGIHHIDNLIDAALVVRASPEPGFHCAQYPVFPFESLKLFPRVRLLPAFSCIRQTDPPAEVLFGGGIGRLHEQNELLRELLQELVPLLLEVRRHDRLIQFGVILLDDVLHALRRDRPWVSAAEVFDGPLQGCHSLLQGHVLHQAPEGVRLVVGMPHGAIREVLRHVRSVAWEGVCGTHLAGLLRGLRRRATVVRCGAVRWRADAGECRPQASGKHTDCSMEGLLRIHGLGARGIKAEPGVPVGGVHPGGGGAVAAAHA
mmetsp:Transcript_50227/g.89646  ORF Transcript_50227/g.89646 Transcript_50227/m.89646 type:complete len:313 (+) Transcript_50227:1348-2286(+)